MSKVIRHQTIEYSIIRRTSKYNKYIKWFAETYHDDGSLLSSAGYRTEREARESVVLRENPFPMGNTLTYVTMKERGNRK